MEKYKRWIVVLLAVAIASGLICAVCSAADNEELVTIDLKDVDAKTAIDVLFKSTGRQFAVDAQVTGYIPIFSVKDTPFDVALKTLCKTAGLVYRVDNNIYIISKKPDTTEMMRQPESVPTELAAVDTTTTAESIIDKIPLSHTGASELLNMMNGNANNTGTSGFGSGMSGFGSSTSGFGSSMGGMSSFGGMSMSSGFSGSNSGYSGSTSRSW
jgi:type II secretory pathway component GspD/PulD (secretin)